MIIAGIASILHPPARADSDGEISSEIIYPPASDRFIPTPALSNRLGNPEIADNPNLVEAEAEFTLIPQAASALTVEPVFSERTSSRLDLAGQSPNDASRKRLSLGDFDNDGNEDILVARWTDDVQLFINRAGVLSLTQGAFANPSDIANAKHVGVADLNGDGWQDLVVRDKLLLNLGEDGAGNWLGFGAGTTIAGAETDPFTVQTADFDGDGDTDVATSPGRRMLVNDGIGNLVHVASRMGSNTLLNVIKFEALDIDGDGDIDLAGPEMSEEFHYLYFNDGAGGFPDGLRFELPIDTLTYTQVGADFNGDNIADFRIYADDRQPRSFMSNGNFVGGFPQWVRRIDGDLIGDNGKHGLAHIRDIDSDGDLDFILSSLELFFGRFGSFNEKTEIIVNDDVNAGTFSVFADPEWRDEESFDARIVDIDLDGKMDLFIAHQGRLAVYLQDAAPLALEITGHSTAPAELGTDSSFDITVAGDTTGIATTWHMGDGNTFNTGGNLSITHSYSAPGRYLVTASVVNGPNRDSHVFWHTVYETHANPKPVHSTSIVYQDLGDPASLDLLWSVNPDHDSVSAVLAGSGVLVGEVPVGAKPSSIAFGGDGRLYVVNKDDATISIIDTVSLSVVETYSQLPPASQPHGIVFVQDSSSAIITLQATGQLAKIEFSDDTLTLADAGPDPRELGINAGGDSVYVSRFITGKLPGEDSTVVSTTQGGGEVRVVRVSDLVVTGIISLAYNDQPDTETSSRGIPNLLMAPLMAPNGKHAFVPASVSNIYRGQFRDGSNREHNKLVRSMLAKLDLQASSEIIADRHDFDNSSQPTAGAFDPTGNYLYLVFEASRKLRVFDVYAGAVLENRDLGFAPRGVAVAPDGKRIYVDNFLGRSLHVFDASSFIDGDSAEHAQVMEAAKVSTEPLAPVILSGKRLFHDSADERLSAQSYISCATCHPDGGHDGRTWDFSDVGEGLRNTIDLRGRAGTGHGFVHWTANFDEIQDFENDIRDIFQGDGLMSNEDFAGSSATLGNPKGGLSSDLDALAAYVASLDSPGQSPYRTAGGAKTAQAIAGQQVFESSNCAACHSGPSFSDSVVGGLFHDIGTVDADTGGRLGGPLVNGGLDTPTLKGLWNGAPYLHDGSAATVADAILAHRSAAVGFDVTGLSVDELGQLEQFLLQIGDEDAANIFPAADAGNDQTITDTDDSGAEPVNLDGGSSDDPDGAIVAFVWSSDTGVTIAPGVTSTASFPVGVHNVTLTVTDDRGATASDTVLITINSASFNLPPVANAGADQTVTDDDNSGAEAINLSAALSFDSDGTIVDFQWNSDTGVTIPAGENTAASFPVGNHLVTLVVTDDDGATASDTMNVLVEPGQGPPPNQAPAANAGADQILADADGDGFESVTLDASASTDADGTIVSYSWASDTATPIPDGVNPGVDFALGVHVVTLTVTDDDGATATDTMLINVKPVTRACTFYTSTDIPIVLPNQVASVSSNLVSTTAGTISDVNVTVDMAHDWPGDLTMTLTHQQSGTSVVLLDRPGVPATQYGCRNDDVLAVFDDDGALDAETACAPAPPAIAGQLRPSSPLSAFNQQAAASTWVLRIDDAFVTDDPGRLNAWRIEICTEGAGNQAPAANAGADQILADADGDGFESVTLDAAASTDADGTIVSYSWASDTATPIPDGANPSVDFAVGVHVVTLTVTDDGGVTDSDTLLVTVKPTAGACTVHTSTDIPIVLPNQVASVNSILASTTAGAISDVNVTVDMAHDWPGDLSMTLTHQQSGTSVVLLDRPGVPATQYGCQNDDVLAVFDDDGTLDAETACAPAPPAIAGQLRPSSPLSAFNQQAAASTWVLRIDDAYVAADTGRLNAWSIEICTEGAGNQAPAANAGADQILADADGDGFESVTLDAAASTDADGTIVSYSWASDTATPIPDGANPTTDFAVGVHVVTLTVTDDGGATDTDTLLVTVKPTAGACTVHTSTDIPIVLPNQVASVNSILASTTAGAISDVNVTVDMAHDWPGDLTMTLTHQQSGTSVVLLDRPGVPATQYGCRNDDLLAVFDDDGTLDAETACAPAPPAVAGQLRPSSPLSAFNQQAAASSWVLRIDDAYVAEDPGRLNAWSIEICTGG